MDGRTGGSGVASPAVEPSVQSGWKGWDVWVALDSAWRFVARWLRQLAEGPLLNRSLFAGAGVGSNGVLPVALVTTILLAGALFRSPQGGPTRLGRANQTFEPSNLKVHLEKRCPAPSTVTELEQYLMRARIEIEASGRLWNQSIQRSQSFRLFRNSASATACCCRFIDGRGNGSDCSSGGGGQRSDRPDRIRAGCAMRPG